MNHLAVLSLVALAAVSPLGQLGRSRLEIVVNVEARQVPGEAVTEQALRVMQRQLPDGTARVEYVTDGDAVRGTVVSGMFGMVDGTVRLVPRGSSRVYRLNPREQTYLVESQSAGTFEGQTPVYTVRQTGEVKDMLGYKVQRLVTSFRQLVGTQGRSGSGGTNNVEITVRIDNWCTSALRVPSALSDMMDTAQRLVGRRDLKYSRSCPLALESVAKASFLPGFEIVTTVASIRQVSGSELPPGLFELPGTYRQVPRNDQP